MHHILECLCLSLLSWSDSATCDNSESPLVRVVIRHKISFVDCHKCARKKKVILHVIITQDLAKHKEIACRGSIFLATQQRSILRI